MDHSWITHIYAVHFDASRRGNKMLNYSWVKKKAYIVVGRSKEGLLCDPGFEFYWEGARRKQCEDNK